MLLDDTLQNTHGNLIIESTGGVMSPIYGDYFQIDYIADLKIPTLLVINNRKGAINQAILSIEKLKERNIPIFGVVLNGPKDAVNTESIKEYCKISHIFELEPIENITEKTLMDAFETTFMQKSLML
ncbi:MAG: ATP-dependent dethiobiotin synthetase BioD [Chlamydiia bacterium]|nr:ATP-dependent dethiobiotin synthetase BioD [Chlamydiia bacterium]